jgi:membrane-associated phospholipid phosphatase
MTLMSAAAPKKPFLTWELALSVGALGAAMVFNRFADVYIERVGEHAPVSPDLILRHLPGVDVSTIYWWGALSFALFATVTALLRERGRVAYFARAYALLVVARACLMVLTPLHIPTDAISVDSGVIYGSFGQMMTVHHDLFFSMHTASPFLASLLFRERWASRICMGFAVLLGVTVLLLKTHYSLDVAGAFLVTYALYRLEHRWIEPLVRRAVRA